MGTTEIDPQCTGDDPTVYGKQDALLERTRCTSGKHCHADQKWSEGESAEGRRDFDPGHLKEKPPGILSAGHGRTGPASPKCSSRPPPPSRPGTGAQEAAQNGAAGNRRRPHRRRLSKGVHDAGRWDGPPPHRRCRGSRRPQRENPHRRPGPPRGRRRMAASRRRRGGPRPGGGFENFARPRTELDLVYTVEFQKAVRLLMENGWRFRRHATCDEAIRRDFAVFEELAAEGSSRPVTAGSSTTRRPSRRKASTV